MKLGISLNINIPAAERNLAEWHARIVRKLGNDVVARLQGLNPVDTGYSRGRWAFIPPSVAYGTGRVVNDAPYILRLNDGHSKQQPDPGWIELCFFEAVRLLR